MQHHSLRTNPFLAGGHYAASTNSAPGGVRLCRFASVETVAPGPGRGDSQRRLIVSPNSGRLMLAASGRCTECDEPERKPTSRRLFSTSGPERPIAANTHASFALGRMPRVQIFWHILFLLWRHFGGVRLTRNAPRTKQSSRHIVLVQTRLSIFELAVAPVT